jgi:serine/threonine protein kinase
LGHEEEFPWWGPTEKAMAIAGMVMALKYLYDTGNVQQCLKPENIVFDDQKRMRLGNFGPSGNHLYVAPELCTNSKLRSHADAYALALLIYRIVAGGKALPETDEQLGKLLAGRRPEIPNCVNRVVADLIERGWSWNPSERPAICEFWSELKGIRFEIVKGVDCKKVEEYLTWVEKGGDKVNS